MKTEIKASDLRVWNYIMIKTSNDKGIYQVQNIGGYKRIFKSKEDEELYNDIEKALKSKKIAEWHDEMLFGICGGARTGERIIESKLKGIPITEEWLLKCGFKYMDVWLHDEGMLFVWQKDNFSIAEHKGLYYYSFTSSDNYSYLIGVGIEYIHELQNLYYSLTKTELECH